MELAGVEVEVAPPKKQLHDRIPRARLDEILQEHQAWINSGGAEGTRADLSHANLEGADLAGANLQSADLQKANLTGAILSLADLRDAFLFQANLHDADLLGAELQGANLQGAMLATATGLSVQQFAGANLSEAILPEHATEFLGLDLLARSFQNAGRLLGGIVLITLLTSWFVVATKDAQLLTNSSALPIPHLGKAMPVVQLFLIAPLLLLGLYIYFHFYLQRLWEGLAGLPAIFPDGRAVGKGSPRIVVALARNHAKRKDGHRPAALFLEAAISILLAYWLVPATLLLLWARYLTRQDLQGTILQVFATVAATGIAVFLPRTVNRTFRGDRIEPLAAEGAFKAVKTYRRWAAPVGLGVILAALSIGTIRGMPHDPSWIPNAKSEGSSAWAANIFWAAGYNPFPNLTESVISAKPDNWSGRDEDLAQVSGASLNKSSLRFAEAYRVFLAKAHLWGADLRGAFLSEADLRQANLRQANLHAAVLDRARIDHANLQSANLEMANLTRADLRGTNLSFASLTGAILVDATLDDANLYSAILPGATLQLASLKRADLRETNLLGAQLVLADLSWADLWSAKLAGARLQGAKLQNAILIEADLRGAELHGADLQHSLLRGADLSGANLEGADLRDAKGLTPGQVCSAAKRRDALFDEDLQNEVESRCGSNQ